MRPSVCQHMTYHGDEFTASKQSQHQEVWTWKMRNDRFWLFDLPCRHCGKGGSVRCLTTGAVAQAQ